MHYQKHIMDFPLECKYGLTFSLNSFIKCYFHEDFNW